MTHVRKGASLLAAMLALSLSLTAPAPAQAATTVCSGVKGCKQVASVDVDGDGKRDQVGIVSRNATRGGTITLRVRTATKRTMQTTGSDVWWYSRPYFDAAPIDGRKGAEIVVGDTMGAHSVQFRVITYRSGELVTLPPPRVDWQPTRPSRWLVDRSNSFNLGFFRSVSSTGAVTLTSKSAVRNSSGKGHQGEKRVFKWKSDKWVRVSATKVRYSSDKAAWAVGWWHIKGLDASL